jgi:predicted nucleic acid-binding protein
MILVDSSVWIDYFRGNETTKTRKLEELLSTDTLAIGDLILTEVLQGFQNDREFNEARKALTRLDIIELGGADIATRCIEDGHSLLHDDSDFLPFAQHLGLRTVM